MNWEQLDYAVKKLPPFVPEDIDMFLDIDTAMLALTDLHRAFPHLVSRPRRLARTWGKRWVKEASLGHGPCHIIIDVSPHGGELFWHTGALELMYFLVESPWLLDGLTVHLLFGGPDELQLNLRRWGAQYDPLVRYTGDQLWSAISNHWRHPDPMFNDPWSFPFVRGSRLVNSPTAGARAGMMIMQEIADAGEELVLWCSGHNRLIGYGVQFLLRGPNAARACAETEPFASMLGVRLDPGPNEFECARRLPGTVASFEFTTAADLFADDPTVRTGGTAYDAGHLLHPNMAFQATEAPMFGPRLTAPWHEEITLQEANRIAGNLTAWLNDDLARAVEIAWQLEAEDDPFVSATRALAIPSWGTKPLSDRPAWEILSPAERFDVMCARPLYQARKAAPALEMYQRHEKEARSIAGTRPNELFRMLQQAVGFVVGHWWQDLEPQALAPTITLQIVAAQIAAYGAKGIHIESP